MKWLAGIDGGGSKTAVRIRPVHGGEDRTCRVGSICPSDHGIDGYASELRKAFAELAVDLNDVVAVCAGVPCFGEYPLLDRQVEHCTRQLFANARVRCENDCFVAFAGAFGLESGINVVSGTGAIAFGRDDSGATARSNGWHWAFSDEGSGVWLGREAFALFARQIDGRAERGKLYDIFIQELGLSDGYEVAEYYSKHCQQERSALARAQYLLLQAAHAGDRSAADLYTAAAHHLAQSAAAVYRRLKFSGQVKVSYSGGVFQAGELLLAPFRAGVLQQIPASIVQPPRFSPEEGALLAAAELLKDG